MSYPPSKHPEDHLLTWSRGRVLDSLQIILIVSGQGWLETQSTGMQCIVAGMAFMIFPGTWHRYRPDPKTGWEESWIEVRGGVIDNLLSSDTFSPKSPVLSRTLSGELEEVLESIHQMVCEEGSGFFPVLSAKALHLLALCTSADSKRSKPSLIRQSILEAERYLAEHHADSVNIEELARRLGVAYSHFRRAFRIHTGFSPWQYVIRLRLTRAKHLLASSDTKLDEVAANVGFSSGFHLSLAFKRVYGQAPSLWRRSLLHDR